MHDSDKDKLLQAMDQKAARDREAILAEARDQVRDIEAQYEASIGRVEAHIQAEAQRAIRWQEQRLEGQLQVELRRARQSLETRYLQEAFRQARQDLDALSTSPHYRDIMQALISEALDLAGPHAHIEVAASEEKLCREVLKSLTSAGSMHPVEAEPGTVRAVSSDGACRVDNSLQTRLARVESLCPHEVAILLFPENVNEGGRHERLRLSQCAG